ncbi:endonuclease/exonuclease/phosphatase family metal-dependent hydrolase [Loktanella ponticola]|uniref:Endonuclease/exonuclease/phosphatase family metal-dependent hydrolase n=1 Tax=Yoonia ponticola TaxID=1524255 RepID=A0A7W9BI17_9RHOB|nr:endonuclease/exonuclease/phosphatase family protein [Yoonia ponticola]MBB5720816.1 endonuclease/exonuclease/phosphatase family metal-dependent hydrolase [Yoonia ponticola]
MKRILKIALGVVAILVTAVGCQLVRNSGDTPLPDTSQDTLRVATYNVHYINMRKETGAWSRGDWERRKGPMDLAFKEIGADVIAFQEMESFGGRNVDAGNLTLDWLLANNSDYAAAAVGERATFPSTQPILYRKDRLEMLDQGWFFFSETPDVIYSPTFNGSFPAFASWAVFRDQQSDDVFRVVNIHTDYASRTNRLRSVELVAERITPWADAGEALFIVGDLNARFGDQTVEILQNAGVNFAPVTGTTYHLNHGINLFSAIDHIGVMGSPTVVGDPIVLRRQFDGEWPTDHYPVIVDFDLQ